ncbi:MAG: TonB-dependent SusC/RagA subfamily outer membrane receptor, partial [Maribacter sp.]
MRCGIITIIVLLCTTLGFSQTKTITGTISDASGFIPGVNIVAKGTTNGVVTDFDGNYQISNITSDAVLVFSYLGYKTVEIVVGQQDTINVSMEEDTQALDEVIVVGYGTQRKSNVVGSVVSVEVNEATAVPTTNVSEMLRGRAAGVQVNLGDARPGGASNIVIRGNVSVAPNGNSPLIIVDGLPFDNLNDVAPDDIASIEILKDASSTAIYGSRASNGVILVTTKKGTVGKATITYNGYTTVQTVTRNFNLYDGSQFIDLRREANRNRFTGDYLRDENVFSPFELDAIENREFVDWEDRTLTDAL